MLCLSLARAPIIMGLTPLQNNLMQSNTSRCFWFLLSNPNDSLLYISHTFAIGDFLHRIWFRTDKLLTEKIILHKISIEWNSCFVAHLISVSLPLLIYTLRKRKKNKLEALFRLGKRRPTILIFASKTLISSNFSIPIFVFSFPLHTKMFRMILTELGFVTERFRCFDQLYKWRMAVSFGSTTFYYRALSM